MTEVAKSALETAKEKLEAEATATNARRSGVGTRIKVGATRGKNPQAISFEAFDEEKPDTLPKSYDEFIKATGISDEKQIVTLLIEGFNADSYTSASDPIAEYVDASWPEETRKQFRMVVRNYAAGAKVSIEDAVNLIKPGIIAALAAKS